VPPNAVASSMASPAMQQLNDGDGRRHGIDLGAYVTCGGAVAGVVEQQLRPMAGGVWRQASTRTGHPLPGRVTAAPAAAHAAKPGRTRVIALRRPAATRAQSVWSRTSTW
jgi:hypothetical protein